MKKTLIILTSILVGVFVLLSAFAPENDYASEKHFWLITKRFENLKKNSKKVSAPEFDVIIGQSKKFMELFPDSQLVPYAHILIADVHLAKKDYRTGRKKLEGIMDTYADQPHVVESAIAKIIRSYSSELNTGAIKTSQQKKFKEAVQFVFNEEDDSAMTKMFDTIHQEKDLKIIVDAYQRALNDYPTTLLGMQAPFLIAKVYNDQNLTEQSNRALNKAIRYYKTFSEDHEGTPNELQAQQLLVSSYLAKKDLPLAVSTLGKILMKFSDRALLSREQTSQITGLINSLCSQINNSTLANTIYQEFMRTYPKHKFIEIIEGRLSEVNN